MSAACFEDGHTDPRNAQVSPLSLEVGKHLRDFLVPLMAEERQRRALVKAALPGAPVLQRIDWAGNGYQFTVELIEVLAGSTFEPLPGLSPLAALLEECRQVVGLERQSEIDWLCAALRPQPRAPGSAVAPFPGLQPFSEAQAPFFFGRGREVRDLVQMMRAPDNRYICVIGASGSGKSSLIAAGLIPALRQGALPGSQDWLIVRAVPGKLIDPFMSVALALDPMLEKSGYRPDATARKLAGTEADRGEVIHALLRERTGGSELLLFLDQLEELFTLVLPDRVAPFVAFLDAAASHERVRVVAALRDDFYPACLAYEPLVRHLRTGSFPLGPPSLLALYRMITEPAASAGLVFEPGLAERIVEDTGTDSGVLALMAYALHELWWRRAGDRLTDAVYEDFGGVKGAVARRASEVFEKLSDDARSALPHVFRDLVTVGENQRVTRARAPLSRVGANSAARELIEAFADGDARLLVRSGDDREVTVEVAHEALFSAWEPLANWIEQRKTSLELRRRVQVAAADWARSGYDTTHLWPHERLAPVYEALANLGVERSALDEPLRSFLLPEAERLLEELERLDTTHYRRAEIGDRLDRIGDPRRGVGLRSDGLPDIVWCEVPGGILTMEDNVGTFLLEPFCIARYPVSYRQYRSFLEDSEGYRSAQWWDGLKHEPDPGEQYRLIGNCPAENVSWYDAMAYCRWLSSRLGYWVRLPTEWQWQQAARGDQAQYEYPWGPNWIEGCANTSETRLGRTTSVGMYPPGAAQQHGRLPILDLAGNVWEWCRNKFEQVSDVSPGGDAQRALRGGSWVDLRGNARCACRLRGRAGYRGYDYGFRLVRSSTIP